MQTQAPANLDDEKFSDEISVRAGIAITAFAMLACGGALFRLLQGLFAGRSSRILAGLVLAALGIFLLVWVARRAVEWRLSAAAAAAASAFYYAFRANVGEAGKRLASFDRPEVFAERAAAASTALILFIIAGVTLGMHLLGAWRDE